MANNDYAAEEGPNNINEEKTNLLASTSYDEKQVDSTLEVGNDSGTAEGGLLATSSSSPNSNILKVKTSTMKVAFVSVKRPAAQSASKSLDVNVKEIENSSEQEDKFYNLLTGGNLKDGVF